MSHSQNPEQQKKKKANNPSCPKCGSDRTWKSGKRKYKSGDQISYHQAYICSQCNYQFTKEQFHQHKSLYPYCLVCGKKGKTRKGLCDTHYRKWLKFSKIYPGITPQDAAQIDRRKRTSLSTKKLSKKKITS